MATSCEAQRTRAYDEDLRWRIVYQVIFLEKAYSGNLNVYTSTVYRIISLFNSTGGVKKKKYSKNLGVRKLTDIDNNMPEYCHRKSWYLP